MLGIAFNFVGCDHYRGYDFLKALLRDTEIFISEINGAWDLLYFH